MSKTYGNKSALKHGAFTDVVILRVKTLMR